MKNFIIKTGYKLVKNIKNREESIKERKILNTVNRILNECNTVYLELGSGPKKGKNLWTTIDICSGCDIQYDLLKKIPFPDASVDLIYSSHFLEHFYYKDIIKILIECHRTLKENGILSICVPDASLYINRYIKNENIDTELLYKPALHINAPIDYVNYIAYMDGNHRYMFDRKNLAEILKKSGFRIITERGFKEKLDINQRDWESIYFNAVK